MNLTLPKFSNKFLMTVYGLYNFTVRYFHEVFKPPYELKEIFKQFVEIGTKSLGLVSITGFIIGVVLALQAIPMLTKFGAVSLIPTMISLSIVREIGPVITGLICAGKIGSGIGAELGSMKVSEQIDAMQVSATNPFKFLVVTRITAATLMIPLLIVYADTLALFGGFIALNIFNGQSLQLYISTVFSALTFDDVIPSTIKTFFFGFAIGLVGTHEGYNASRGTESVGIAANVSVVYASLLVIILDMIAVQLSLIFY